MMARIKSLEEEVELLREANLYRIEQIKEMDITITNLEADVAALQKQQVQIVTSVTPEDNYYAVMDMPIGP